ncbi:MAG TPA: radical SAM family heme chaperone HemW [Desulfobacteria bacterium]|nr:radical SAM family heme chaperone HemW [Desulfobacteria bacterium]
MQTFRFEYLQLTTGSQLLFSRCFFMAIGLYVHVPFCIRKCSYCDFVSYPFDAGLAASYVCALEKEMEFHVKNLSDEQRLLKSIYIGGGTPTCLSGEQLSALLGLCRRHFIIDDGAEITVECNPGTVNAEKFSLMREAGVNRVSIGVQAFQQKILSTLGRIHTWKDVEDAARACQETGITNVSFDLMFGIPGQSMAEWQESLREIVGLRPKHISAYGLKIEPETPMYRDAARGLLDLCDEEVELEMFLYAIEFLALHGYGHYEISNFALAGMESRHNLIYWQNEEYLGLGPAAHSMLNCNRFSNIESVELYISRLNAGLQVTDSKTALSVEEQMSETVFLGLRLLEGMDITVFEERFGKEFFGVYAKQLETLTAQGLLEQAGKNIRLTAKGLPVANVVFAEFI